MSARRKKPERGDVGARIRELIATRADLSATDIAEMVRREIVGSRPTPASVRCYFTYMRADRKAPQPARDRKARASRPR